MKYQINEKDGVVSITLFNSFSLDTTISIAKKAKSIIEGFSNQPFYMLVDLSQSDGGTPDGFEQTRQFNLWLDEQNLIAKAIVCTSPLLKNINESRVRTSNKQRIEYFETKVDALRWFDELSLQNVI